MACQSPMSMGFSRQGYQSGLPCPPPGDPPDPGIRLTSLMSLAWSGGFFTTSSTWEAHIQISMALPYLNSIFITIMHLHPPPPWLLSEMIWSTLCSLLMHKLLFQGWCHSLSHSSFTQVEKRSRNLNSLGLMVPSLSCTLKTKGRLRICLNSLSFVFSSSRPSVPTLDPEGEGFGRMSVQCVIGHICHTVQLPSQRLDLHEYTGRHHFPLEGSPSRESLILFSNVWSFNKENKIFLHLN